MDSIKDIIPRVVEQMARSRGQHAGGPGSLEQVWQSVLGEQELKHVALRGQRDGNVLVTVDSPARLYHLRMRKAKILKQLQEKIPEIKDIVFKVGENK